MKKTRRIYSLLMLAVFALAGFTTAQAADADGYSELVPGTTYNATSVGAVKLSFTPSSNGTLKVIQTGGYDSHLFSGKPVYSESYGYDNNYDVLISTDYTNVDGGYQLLYGLQAGKTYYIVAKLESGDAVKTLDISWTPDKVDENVIQLGVPYKVNKDSPVYSYTAESDGILSAQWNYYGTEIAQGQKQFFFYYTATPSDDSLVPPYYVGDGDGGMLVKFVVKKGETYFLYQAGFPLLTVVFTLDTDAASTAAITHIEPTPGNVYDVVNFRYYWNLQLQPNAASVDKVELTYTPAGGGSPITIDVPAPEMGGDSFRIPADNLVALIEGKAIENNTFATYTFYGLKAEGNYVTENNMEEGRDYVTIGDEGKVTISFSIGDAIVPTATSFPTPFYQKFPVGSPKAIGTITYSGNVKSISEVTVIKGHIVQGGQTGGDNAPESVSVPDENITIGGNTISIDFGGVDMSSIPAGEVTVYVAGVLGFNGLYADYDGFSVGTFYMTLVEGEAPDTPDEPDQPGTDGVAGIDADTAAPVYYNLQGQRIANPDKGVYIEVKNGKAEKVIFGS